MEEVAEDMLDAVLPADTESIDVSDPVRESAGISAPFMSPKYCSVSCTASAWGIPANATTILSGL